MDANHKPTYKDYYKVLEVDYDATDEKIRLNYRKLALKWHPDKHKGDSAVTAKFQEINEAYTVIVYLHILVLDFLFIRNPVVVLV
ncbi:UNVERIFIED_CONTAM: Chaperone protein DnaJ [Sesamum latifolium]|uniref:Chaperone protein DnaJ n=1 Tax=Sesamum latifolium TaxID=2727402 RepID=A0AAW2T6U1_9LAMI